MKFLLKTCATNNLDVLVFFQHLCFVMENFNPFSFQLSLHSLTWKWSSIEVIFSLPTETFIKALNHSLHSKKVIFLFHFAIKIRPRLQFVYTLFLSTRCLNSSKKQPVCNSKSQVSKKRQGYKNREIFRNVL